jgi:hypothetical protein
VNRAVEMGVKPGADRRLYCLSPASLGNWPTDPGLASRHFEARARLADPEGLERDVVGPDDEVDEE